MPPRKKQFKIEAYFKRNQHTIAVISIIFSLIFSLVAVYYSFESNQLSKHQFKLSNKPNFNYKLVYSDSTSELDAVEFYSLKDNMHLENIELFFPYEFDNDTTQILKGNVWHISFFRDQTKAVLAEVFDIENIDVSKYSYHREEFDIPIIVKYIYVEDGTIKNFPVLYLVSAILHGHKVVRIKSIYFQREINNTTDFNGYLSFYVDVYGYGKTRFSKSNFLDSIISNNNGFKDFYTFLKRYDKPHHHKTLIIDSNKNIIDSLTYILPKFYRDSASYKTFMDSLNSFKIRKSKYKFTIKQQLASIDSFIKQTPYCFNTHDCREVTPWLSEETFLKFKHFIADLKVQQYRIIRKK